MGTPAAARFMNLSGVHTLTSADIPASSSRRLVPGSRRPYSGNSPPSRVMSAHCSFGAGGDGSA